MNKKIINLSAKYENMTCIKIPSWILCILFILRRRQMVVYPSPEKRLESRILRRIRCLHICTGRIQWILQPTSSMDTIHHGQHSRPDRWLEDSNQEQSEYFFLIHCLPSIPVCINYLDSWDYFLADIWSDYSWVWVNTSMARTRR